MSALAFIAWLYATAFKYGFWLIAALVVIGALWAFLEALRGNEKNMPKGPTNHCHWLIAIGLFALAGCASKEVGFYPPYSQLPVLAYEQPSIEKPNHCSVK